MPRLEKFGEWTQQLDHARKQLAALEGISTDYRERAKKAIELAQSAHSLFLKQEPPLQRELLQNVLSNCFMKDGRVEPEYRKPFELLAFAAREFGNEKTDPGSTDLESEKKWAQLDSNQ